MGRFIYVPLDFNTNKDRGLERELLIKKDTDDLYALDDFKVPVSATKKIKDDANGIDSNIDEILSEIRKINDLLIEYKDTSSSLNKELISYEEVAENDLYKRIEVLSQTSVNLRNLLNEINEDWSQEKTIMNTIYNKYTVMIEKLINEIKAKYTSELGYFDKYKNWLTTYQTKIDKINKDIATMEAEISLKQDKLGEGSGSWSGRVVTSTETDLYVYGHCYWLGNNHEQYGGMLTGGGKDDMGGAYWSDGTPAHIDAIFGVDRGYEGTMPEGGTLEDRIDSTSPIELTEDNRHEIFEKLKEADANGTLEEVDQYWDGDLEEGSWKSLSSGTINKFRKKVTVIYKISYGTTTTTDL